MPADARANFTGTTVATAPSPATSGLSLVVAAGAGAGFPTAPFNAVVWPAGVSPTNLNAEIVRVTARVSDTLTITRTQESTSARTIVVGDQIAQMSTKQFYDDIEAVATSSVKGMMSAADKASADRAKLAQVNLADFSPDQTGVTSSNAAITSAMAALPAAGGFVLCPTGTYLITANIVITGYMSFLSVGRSNVVFTTDSPTIDMFTINQWFVTFDGCTFQGRQTTVAVASNGAASSAGTLNVGSTTGFAASGTISVTLSNGTWITLSYTGVTGTSFTGVTGGTATTVATNALVINRTAGFAINASSNSYSYTLVNNCRFVYMFHCVANGSVLMSMNECEFRNFVGIGIDISSTSDRYLRQIVMDNAIQSQSAIRVTQVGALLMLNCDLIHCGNVLDIAPGAGVTVPSIKATNVFFDNSITGVRMVSAGSWFRSNFTNCWMSSMTTAGVLLGPTTAGNMVDGITFNGCEMFNTGPTGSGISITTTNVGKWTLTGGSRIAGWTSGISLTAGAAHFPNITNNQIGPVAAFGANTIGILCGPGTYLGLIVGNNDVTGNGTAFSNAGVTAAGSNFRVTDNPGINPRSTNVAPAVPASTVAVTNTSGFRVKAFVKAGTLTAITVNGVATGIAAAAGASLAHSIQLEPGATIAVTYSVAPTWVWITD